MKLDQSYHSLRKPKESRSMNILAIPYKIMIVYKSKHNLGISFQILA